MKVPALVSSTILMAMVGGTGRLFTNSMDAIDKASTGDGLNAGIASDLEYLRNQFAHRFPGPYPGSYAPVVSAELGAEFLSHLSNLGLKDQDDEPSNGIQTTEAIAERSVQRSLKVTGHTVEVSYSHAGETLLTTTLLSPATGWLP